MKCNLRQTALLFTLLGLATRYAGADLQQATAALNAPVVNIGGNSDFEWGPIVSQTDMSLQGASDVHYPQKFAGGVITAKGGSAGNATYCQNGPASDGLEYFCGLNPPPSYPHINFADYRALAQLEGNSCGGQPCLNPTNLSGIQDAVCLVNGQPKIWFFDGDAKFSGSTSFCGVLVSQGAVTFNGSGTGTYSLLPPSNAWMQYQVATPAGGPDTSALNQYPGDSGFQQSNTTVTLTGVSFNGYIYTTNGYSAAGGAVILGAVQFGAGASSTQGGAKIYFTSQPVFVQPPTGQADQPIIFPAGGCSSTPVSVSIIDGTQGASIYYTLDGSAPSASSTLYTGPFTIGTGNPSVTVTAIAVASGMKNSLTATSTFTFSAQCGGTTPPPSLTFSANPTTITSGGSSTLSWTIANATSAVIDQGIGAVSTVSGSLSVSPASTTTYTLTAWGLGGKASAQVTVNVVPANSPAPSINFTANPTTINAGSFSTLSWAIANATSAVIDQGIGTISPVSGSIFVSPANSTTYTLTAWGPGGSSAAMQTVTVQAAPPPPPPPPPPAPVLTTVRVSPQSASLLINSNQQFIATGYDQFGSTIAVTTPFVWSNDNPPNTISQTGLYQSGNVAEGDVVRATNSGIQGSAIVTVNSPTPPPPPPPPGQNPVLTKIVVTPQTATIFINAQAQFTAQGYDQYGNLMNVASFAWSNTNNPPNSINASGLYQAGGSTGNDTVIAANQGIQGTASVTITATTPTNPPPARHRHLVVTPSQASMHPGDSLPFSCASVDDLGNSIPVTPNWSTSGAGSISAIGVFKALNTAPTATVTATLTNNDPGTAQVIILAPGAATDISNAYPYPVPWKSTGGVPYITFTNLAPNTKIRLFTTDGRKVIELNADAVGSPVQWHLQNGDGERVASGVYFYILDNSSQTKKGKLVIIQ